MHNVSVRARNAFTGEESLMPWGVFKIFVMAWGSQVLPGMSTASQGKILSLFRVELLSFRMENRW